MNSVIAQGKNVQKAIENGLKELNATQDQVSIKIIDEGGLFRKAKVELTLDKEFEEKVTKKEDVLVKKEDKKIEEKTEENLVKEEEKKTEEPKTFEEKLDKKEENKKAEVKENKKEENLQKAENKQDIETLGKEFLAKLFSHMNVEANVESFETEAGITFNASGEKVSTLIGKRGETLNAIQEILSNIVKNAGYREKKVFFDVENYKNRREMSLINLAERMASKALKINKPIKLEKMSAYERKIIHTALQNREGVTSKSEGEEPNRRLVIIPVKKD